MGSVLTGMGKWRRREEKVERKTCRGGSREEVGSIREEGGRVPGRVPRGVGLICWGTWVCATDCRLIATD